MRFQTHLYMKLCTRNKDLLEYVQCWCVENVHVYRNVMRIISHWKWFDCEESKVKEETVYLSTKVLIPLLGAVYMNLASVQNRCHKTRQMQYVYWSLYGQDKLLLLKNVFQWCTLPLDLIKHPIYYFENFANYNKVPGGTLWKCFPYESLCRSI